MSKGVGKSSLTRLLVNQLLNVHPVVAYMVRGLFVLMVWSQYSYNGFHTIPPILFMAHEFMTHDIQTQALLWLPLLLLPLVPRTLTVASQISSLSRRSFSLSHAFSSQTVAHLSGH